MMGGSAGANLAMLAAYSAGDPRLPPSTDVPPVAVRSVINFYGPTDMTLLYRTCKSPEYVRPLMKEYLGGTPDDFPERYRALSPLSHITAKAPPTITLIGTSDRLVSADHATLLGQALSSAAVPHEMYLLPASDHGFDTNWGGFGTQIAWVKIKLFLERYVTAEGPRVSSTPVGRRGSARIPSHAGGTALTTQSSKCTGTDGLAGHVAGP